MYELIAVCFVELTNRQKERTMVPNVAEPFCQMTMTQRRETIHWSSVSDELPEGCTSMVPRRVCATQEGE